MYMYIILELVHAHVILGVTFATERMLNSHIYRPTNLELDEAADNIETGSEDELEDGQMLDSDDEDDSM